MPLLDTSLGGLHYEVEGNGPPLMLLHGLACDITMWERQIPALSREFTLILLDNRGMGRSIASPTDITTRSMARDAALVLDHLGVSACGVLGYSLGSLIAQWLALDRPELVSRLVLAASTGCFPARQRIIFRGWEKLFREGTPLSAFLDMVLPWTFANAFLEDPAACEIARQRLAIRRYPPRLDGYAAQTAALLDHDTRGQAERIIHPTLLLAGDDDLLAPPTQSSALAAVMPNARVHVLDSCGHQLLVEKAEEVNGLVAAFLARE